MLRITAESIKSRIAERLRAPAGEQENGAPKDLFSIPNDEQFLHATYRRLFGRDVDLDAFIWLSDTLRTNTRKFIFDTLQESPEAAAYAQRRGGPVELSDVLQIDSEDVFVKAAHSYVLRREPDAGTAEFYLSLLAKGVSRTEVLARLAFFADSGRCFTIEGAPLERAPAPAMPEEKGCQERAIEVGDLLSAITAEQFISAAYLRMFGRRADPTGVAHWTCRLRQGMTRAAVLLDLARSEEARPPYTVDGIPLEKAARIAEVFPMEAEITDLTALSGMPDDIAFVHAAYAVILGRSVDSDGLTFSLDLLRTGTTREQLLARIVSSDEAVTRRRQFSIGSRLLEAAAEDCGEDVVDLADVIAVDSDVDFFNAAHLLIRGRHADDADRASGLGQFAQGISRIEVLLALASSQEAVPKRYRICGVALEEAAVLATQWRKTGPADDLTALDGIEDPGEFVFESYRRILMRLPDFDGFSTYWTLAKWGIPKINLAARIAFSNEAARRNRTFTWNGLPISAPAALSGWVRLRLALRRLTGPSGAAANAFAVCRWREEFRRRAKEQAQLAALANHAASAHRRDSREAIGRLSRLIGRVTHKT